MIEVKNISQAYGKLKILDNVSLKVQENKITALVGSNGAGKSTLLGVMARLLPQISGEVLLDGENILNIKSKEVAKNIAILKQVHNVSIKITVEELVEFGRFPHCEGRLKDEDKKIVEEYINYMDLEKIRYKNLDELSGGQRQRAFIAMILAQDTKYVFLDEPLNNLDIKYSVEMMKIIKRLTTELGKTVVIVLHDINFAAAYADYVVAMKDGAIIEEGPCEDIISKKVLDKVYDHDFHIVSHDGRKVCLYYDQKNIDQCCDEE